MPTELEQQLLRENKILREQIARLLSQKVELQRQLEDLAREREQTAVAAILASVARSIRDADAALQADAGDRPRFTIGEVDATFRGTIIASPQGVGLRLPVPEHGVLPGHLGSIRMAMTAIPPPAASPAAVALVPPTPDERLQASLEQVQHSFSQRKGAGKAAADDIVDHTVALLTSAQARNQPGALATGLEGIASGLTRSAKALSARGPAAEVTSYREAAKGLQTVSRAVRTAAAVTDADRTRTSEILEALPPPQGTPPSPRTRKPKVR